MTLPPFSGHGSTEGRRRDPAGVSAPLAAALLCLAAVSSFAASAGAVEERVNPHAFMSEPDQCTTCHQEKPEPGQDNYTTVTFVGEIVALCSGCHEDAHYRDEHPVEIRPESEVPEEFHLDDYQTMTCATCHDPHGPFEAAGRFVPPSFLELARSIISRRQYFPTYFLRMSNAKGELCVSCHKQGVAIGEDAGFSADLLPEYVGSEKCSGCHPDIYREWGRTLHARNFQDAARDPSVIRARFEGKKPFPPEKILYTVGEHWVQGYIFEGRKGLMVRPDRWSILGEGWASGTGSFSRPWLRYCAGCHTTALNPYDGSYVERGTGCESCHGPGLRHTESTDQFDVVNPSLLVQNRWDMVCESCHTSGHDRSGKFRFPVGYRPGEDLMRYYQGLVPKAGQGAEDFKGDGSYEDRHRQFEFWAGRVNILQGLSCDVCTGHSRPAAGEVKTEATLTDSELCGTCHREIFDDYESHAEHTEGQAKCVDCHPPAVSASGDSFSIHDHKFRFGRPAQWMIDGVDRCERCHAEGADSAAL
jgi:hypothetical protein